MTIGVNKYNTSNKESIEDIRLKRAKKKADDNIQIKFGNSISYNSSSDMALLANTESISGVRGLQNSIRAHIKMVKSSGADEEQIKKIVRQMKGVLKKADIKVGRLRKEAMLKKQEIAAENSEIKSEIKEQLKKKRKGRKAIENSQIASTDNVAPGRARDAAKAETYKIQSNNGSNTVEVKEIIPTVSIDTTVSTAEGSDTDTTGTVDATV